FQKGEMKVRDFSSRVGSKDGISFFRLLTLVLLDRGGEETLAARDAKHIRRCRRLRNLLAPTTAFFNTRPSARIGGREHGPGKKSPRCRRRSRRRRNAGACFQPRGRIQRHRRGGRRGGSAPRAGSITSARHHRFDATETARLGSLQN